MRIANIGSLRPNGQGTLRLDGREHSCGLRTNGNVECWGSSDYNQAESKDGPFVAIGAGEVHSCALRARGDIICWGYSGSSTSAPGGSFKSMSVGSNHGCALREDGTAVCWGASSPPTGSFVTVTAGSYHSCLDYARTARLCAGER